MEFWEAKFKEKQEMWGWDCADSVYETYELFKKHNLNEILIPGFGYGRNAKYFIDKGMKVSGIEISETAIELAKKHFGDEIRIFHASVDSMPLEDKKYDGIFSYSLLHLLDQKERIRFIANCYNQLKPDGLMVFVTISKKDPRFAQGREISKDYYETWPGLNLYFYDSDSILLDFEKFGLLEAKEIEEKSHHSTSEIRQYFCYIVCKKEK
jgi:SAM-dependent methyltransferase